MGRCYDSHGPPYGDASIPHCTQPIENALELEYEHDIMLHYQQMIHERVGVSHEGFKDLKSIKISPPDSYSGEDDIEVFNNWIAGLLRWLRIQNMCRRRKDSLRIDLCRSTLKGLTADWFMEEVESFHRSIDVWQFEDIICMLYKHFIHRVTVQSATDKYKKTKFIKAEGALAFYNNLKHHANCMVQRPDDYSFRRDFRVLLGLPQDIMSHPKLQALL
jgi:hypothetical protein